MISIEDYTQETNGMLEINDTIITETVRKILKIMYDDGFIIRCGYIPLYSITECGSIELL